MSKFSSRDVSALLYIQQRSLIFARSLMNCLHFHVRIDYIIIFKKKMSPISTHLSVRDFSLVVEPYLTVLVADCQLLKHLGFNHMPSD